MNPTHSSRTARGAAAALRVARTLCLALPLLGAGSRASGAVVTNYLFNNPNRLDAVHSLAINVGDTVVWINAGNWSGATNFVQSYGGEWNSGLLYTGQWFSVTFTNAGFYAYRTAWFGPGPGTVTVNVWTSAPPAVTINTPVQGSMLATQWTAFVQASVMDPENLASIEYFANSNSIGAGAVPPYWVQWTNAPPGPYVLLAKATDLGGGVTWSRPVHVTVDPRRGDFVWGPRVLATGEVLFFYNSGTFAAQFTPIIHSFDSLVSPNPTNSTSSYATFGPSVFVDESLRGTSAPCRFYTIVPATP
jgi:hypothetical protein